MKRLFRTILSLLAVLLIGFSGCKLYGIYREYGEGKALYSDVAGQYVRPNELSAGAGQEATEETAAPVTIDFDALLQSNEDIVAWIYCEDTNINYPVVQAGDNDYYLRRMLDGSYNIAGTIFMDCRSSADFSDLKTIIYGHNMKNDTMFGSLLHYREQAYYDSHPVIWILTQENCYRLELLAGYTTSSDEEEDYGLCADPAALSGFLTQAVEKSTFRSDVELSSVERAVVLSTCSYEYDEARYVLIGSLIRVTLGV